MRSYCGLLGVQPDLTHSALDDIPTCEIAAVNAAWASTAPRGVCSLRGNAGYIIRQISFASLAQHFDAVVDIRDVTTISDTLTIATGALLSCHVTAFHESLQPQTGTFTVLLNAAGDPIFTWLPDAYAQPPALPPSTPPAPAQRQSLTPCEAHPNWCL